MRSKDIYSIYSGPSEDWDVRGKKNHHLKKLLKKYCPQRRLWFHGILCWHSESYGPNFKIMFLLVHKIGRISLPVKI